MPEKARNVRCSLYCNMNCDVLYCTIRSSLCTHSTVKKGRLTDTVRLWYAFALSTPVTPLSPTEKRLYRKPDKIFPESKLRDLSPNFYIHISVDDLYMPTIGLAIWLQENCWTQS